VSSGNPCKVAHGLMWLSQAERTESRPSPVLRAKDWPIWVRISSQKATWPSLIGVLLAPDLIAHLPRP